MASLSRQQSVSGRASRASNASSRSRAGVPQATPPTGDMFTNAASGVMSMLKTSTDVGDIGEFSFNTGRLPAMLRPSHQRRNHPARLSGSSAHSTYTSQTNHSRAQSQMSRRTSNAPNNRGWDAVSAVSSANGNGMGARHGSMVSLQTLPPHEGRAPVPRGYPRSSPYGPPLPYAQEGRSYSLTQPQPPSSLRPVRSAASLRSQAHGQFQPPRPPFAYPARTKRPGLRTPPPAQGDYSAYQIPYGPPGTFGDDRGYSNDYPQHYAGPHPVPYGNPYNQQQEPRQGPPTGHYYGHGGGPHPGGGMHRPHGPTYGNELYESSVIPRYPGNAPAMLHQPGPERLVELDAYEYGPALTQQRYAVPGRQAVSRAGTPLAEPLPSSSEPGSSAPPSSNPPTPRDVTTVHVKIDPASSEPAFGELSDEYSEYKRVQSYIRYAEQPALYELDAAVPAVELETNTPSLRTGFVKRIKHLLEDRAAGQETVPPSEQTQAQQDTSRKIVIPPSLKHSGQELLPPPVSKRSSVHEPFELDVPARITRTLIKANTAPSSSEQNTTTSIIPDEATTPIPERFVQPEPPQTHTVTAAIAAAGTLEPQDQVKNNIMELTTHIDLSKQSPPRHRLEHEHQGENAGELNMEELESGCVSSLRSPEKVIRDSVVSPMATQTVQITAIHEAKQPQDRDSGGLGASGSPQIPPAAKQYVENSDLGSGFSLALETNQELGPSTEPVTDIAIKFSLPRTADRGKAQLVNLSSLSETPIQTSVEASKKEGTEDNTLHSSFSSINKVAPLQVRKMESLSPILSEAEGADFSSFIRRSFPRKKSLWPTGPSSVRDLGDQSLDFQPLPIRPHAGRLSGLKEDSKEDVRPSTSGLRLSNSQMFHLNPGREDLKPSEETIQSSYLTPRPPRMSLSELRSMPSLNFSRMNLVDRLNEALDTRGARTSRSLEAVRQEKVSSDPPVLPVGPTRSVSVEAFRDRYTSFFTRPDGTDIAEAAESDVEDSEGLFSETTSANEQSSTEIAHPPGLTRADSGIVSKPSMDRSYSRSVRPRSPGRILSVAQEVNRLSIPSVAALSERLSELLPSIKHLNLDSAVGSDRAVKNTIDEIHHLGRPESDNTGLLRSSTGLRQLAAVADNIAVHGTHDSAILDTRNGRLMKELPPLPEDTEKFSLSESGLDRNTTLIEGLSSTAELEAPKPALLRGKSLSGIDSRDEDLHPGYSNRRSLVLSSQSLRPWNQEENYPWCGNSPALNIALPSPVVHRESSTSETIRRTSKVSSNTPSDTEGTAEPESTILSSQLVSSSDIITPPTGMSHRRSSKKSIIGSLSRRMGLNARSQSKTAVRESTFVEKPHSAGDRYPNTGLQPPNTFNLDEVRSFFSDSTSEDHGEARRGSFRKHITSLRSKLPNNQSYSQSLDMHRARSHDYHGRDSHANASGSLFDDRFTEHITPPNYDGMVGMGKMEFRVKRVAERLRRFWTRSGDMIRSISQRNRPAAGRQHRDRHTETDNWLADSLYSGD